MASKQQHINQWKHNRNFVATIATEYHDWIVTVLFYAALHAIDALLMHDGQPVTSHIKRNELLRSDDRYQEIYAHYEPLYTLSRTVRYVADPRKWIPPQQVKIDVVQRHFYPIEGLVLKLIGESFQFDPLEIK